MISRIHIWFYDTLCLIQKTGLKNTKCTGTSFFFLTFSVMSYKPYILLIHFSEDFLFATKQISLFQGNCSKSSHIFFVILLFCGGFCCCCCYCLVASICLHYFHSAATTHLSRSSTTRLSFYDLKSS